MSTFTEEIEKLSAEQVAAIKQIVDAKHAKDTGEADKLANLGSVGNGEFERMKAEMFATERRAERERSDAAWRAANSGNGSGLTQQKK